MDWNSIIITLLGLLTGGSLTWLFTIKATRRKANGEAQQTEVEAWKSMQDVYQQTIEDLNKYCEDIRTDRTHLREDRDALRALNDELQQKYQSMENELMELKSQVARQGRKIEALLPFTCAVIGCMNRTKVDVNEAKIDDETINK
jgi:peptidoglycan hydrolase CwlO-like protein